MQPVVQISPLPSLTRLVIQSGGLLTLLECDTLEAEHLPGAKVGYYDTDDCFTKKIAPFMKHDINNLKLLACHAGCHSF